MNDTDEIRGIGVTAVIPDDVVNAGASMSGHNEELDDPGRKTQKMMNPFASINWEPSLDTFQLDPEAPLSRQFDKFEMAVVRKHPYAWSSWDKIRKSIPGDMQNLLRSMWETYWHSAAMGPEPFRTVLALVRRKLGLPYHEEVLHKLQARDDEAVQDEQAESSVSEVHEDGEVGDGDQELGEVNSNEDA